MSVKGIVKGATKATLPISLAVGGLELADRVSTPLLGKLLDAVGLLKFIPAAGQAFITKAMRAAHAVGGFALGHGAADWIGKKIG